MPQPTTVARLHSSPRITENWHVSTLFSERFFSCAQACASALPPGLYRALDPDEGEPIQTFCAHSHLPAFV